MSEARRWRALSVGLIAAFMSLLDVSIVNVAIPSIQANLGVGSSGLQWVLSGYALMFGLLLVPAGRFGDAHGVRLPFIAGLAAFTLASAAAGAARSETWLVLARLVQGAAAGVVTPQVTGLIQRLFLPAERGRPFGMLGGVIGVATALGPLLGGLLIEAAGAHDGWRWVFYINIPVGAVAIVLGWRLVPAAPAGEQRGRSLDPVGVLLLGAAIVQILLPLVQEQQWRTPAKWLLLVTGALTLVGFVAWERRYARHRDPLVDLSLFRRRSYALGTTVALLYFAGFTTIFFIFTLFLQRGLGYSALQAGLTMTPFALGSGSAALLGGRVVTQFGRALVAVGLITVAAGLTATMIVVALVPSEHTALAITLPLLLAGIGAGLVITPNQTLTLAEVPVARAGSASGVVQTAQRVGAAFGIAAVGSVFFARLAATDGDWPVAFRTAITTAIGFMLLSLVAASVDIALGSRRALRRRARWTDARR